MTATTTHQPTTLNVAELKERLENVRSDCISDSQWPLCSSCESGLSPTDLTAERCTNCGEELVGLS